MGMEKFLKTIRANPEKAESLYGKFEKMVEEEEKDQDGSGANLSRQPPLMRSQRTVESKTGGVPGAELGTRDEDQDSGLSGTGKDFKSAHRVVELVKREATEKNAKKKTGINSEEKNKKDRQVKNKKKTQKKNTENNNAKTNKDRKLKNKKKMEKKRKIKRKVKNKRKNNTKVEKNRKVKDKANQKTGINSE